MKVKAIASFEKKSNLQSAFIRKTMNMKILSILSLVSAVSAFVQPVSKASESLLCIS